MLPFLCPYPCLDFPFVFQQAAQDSALIKMQSLKAAKKKTKKPSRKFGKKKKNYHESLCFRLPCGLEVSSSLGLAKGVQSCKLSRQF